MHTWLAIHVEIPAEHPVVYANYAYPNFFIIVNYMYQAYEQMNKVLQGHWERMTICQYRFHSIIHVIIVNSSGLLFTAKCDDPGECILRYG